MALLDEGFGHAADRVDAAVEPHRRIDAVRQQVAGDAAAGNADIEPPEALRRPAAGPWRWSSPAGTWRGSGRSCRACLRRSAAWPASPPARGGSCTRPCWHARPSPPPRPSCCDSAAERPSGFSHITILPASAAAMAISMCVSLGLAMSIRSMSLVVNQFAPVGLGGFIAPLIGERLALFGVAGADRS